MELTNYYCLKLLKSLFFGVFPLWINYEITREWVEVLGAIHQPKFPEIFVQSSMEQFSATGKISKPFDVDHFSRGDRYESWLNGSDPFKLLSTLQW